MQSIYFSGAFPVIKEKQVWGEYDWIKMYSNVLFLIISQHCKNMGNVAE